MNNYHFQSFIYPLFSGVLLVLTTTYVGFWPIVTIALIPYGLFLVNTSSSRRVFLATLLMSIPFSVFSALPFFRLSGSWWVGEAHVVLNEAFLYSLAIAIIIFIASFLYTIPALLYMKARRRFPAPIFLFAIVWVLIECFRSWILFGGYSWGVLGYALIDSTYLKHVASVFGVYSLSFLSVMMGLWGASIISDMLKIKGSLFAGLRSAFFASIRLRDSLIVTLCFVCAIAFGIYRELRGSLPISPMRVAVVVSNIPTHESINENSYHTYRQFLQKALEAKANIVVLPENVFPYFIIDEETDTLASRQEVYLSNAHELYADILSLSRMYPEAMLAIPLHSNKQGLRYNSILYYQNGKIVNAYHKRMPIPFMEYAPLGLRVPLYEKIAKGDMKQDFQMGNVTLSGYLCSEVGFTQLASGNTDIIIAPSNDSVLASAEIGELQHQFARMRALETGTYVLRSSKGGISSIIDPYGRVLEEKNGTNGIMILDVK